MYLKANSTDLTAYQEVPVQGRESETCEIITGVHELNEITHDLATIIIIANSQ